MSSANPRIASRAPARGRWRNAPSRGTGRHASSAPGAATSPAAPAASAAGRACARPPPRRDTAPRPCRCTLPHQRPTPMTEPPDDAGGWNSDLPTFIDSEPKAVRIKLEHFVCAWDDSIPWLQRECRELVAAYDAARAYTAILEYELPRESRRPDVIVLENGVVVVLELNKAYHRECADRPVHAVLVPSRGDATPRDIDGVRVVGHAPAHPRARPEPAHRRGVPAARRLRPASEPRARRPRPVRTRAAAPHQARPRRHRAGRRPHHRHRPRSRRAAHPSPGPAHRRARFGQDARRPAPGARRLPRRSRGPAPRQHQAVPMAPSCWSFRMPSRKPAAGARSSSGM